MIRGKQGKNGEIIYVYQSPTVEKELNFFENLNIIFEDYRKANGIESLKVDFDFKLINEIYIRVDRRKDYYITFHDETYLSEVREAALIAFWLLKFKPFLITPKDGKDYNFSVNCGFALYIILCAVSEDIEREYGGEKVLSIDGEYLEKYKYAFKYWDLSKEALMLLAETLCKCVKDAR